MDSFEIHSFNFKKNCQEKLNLNKKFTKYSFWSYKTDSKSQCPIKKNRHAIGPDDR